MTSLLSPIAHSLIVTGDPRPDGFQRIADASQSRERAIILPDQARFGIGHSPYSTKNMPNCVGVGAASPGMPRSACPTFFPGLSRDAVAADDDARFVFTAVVVEGAATGDEGQAFILGGTDDLLDGGGIEIGEFVVLHPIDFVDED